VQSGGECADAPISVAIESSSLLETSADPVDDVHCGGGYHDLAAFRRPSTRRGGRLPLPSSRLRAPPRLTATPPGESASEDSARRRGRAGLGKQRDRFLELASCGPEDIAEIVVAGCSGKFCVHVRERRAGQACEAEAGAHLLRSQ
jgi:hypothetical protein